jgi:hypothetical protein
LKTHKRNHNKKKRMSLSLKVVKRAGAREINKLWKSKEVSTEQLN